MVLTKQQKKVLDYIAVFLRERGYSPSFQEIASGLELRSVATVHKHIEQLERKGCLRRGRHRGRSLELGPKYMPDERDELGALELPLLGRIKPGKAIESVNPPVSIPLIDLKKNGGIVLYQVQGNPFEMCRILDGDYILVESSTAIEDGDIVLVLMDAAECALKRYWKQPDDRIRLESADGLNDATILPASRVIIQGKAIGVLRLY